VGLGAEQDHVTGEAPLAQGDGGLHPGHARTRHDDAPQRGRTWFLRLLAHLITIDT
jgi:hypothetical protein